MRWSSLVSEAWRNVSSGTALVAQLAALIGALTVAIIAFGAVDVAALAAQSEHYRQSGANVLILTARGNIDPAACESLTSISGVRAGALRRAPHDLVAAALPGSSVPTYEVTPGLTSMLTAGSQQLDQGVLLSKPAAEALGAEHRLSTTTGTVTVSDVYAYPRDGRRTDLEFAVLSPTTSSAAFDECWAETWPQSDQLESLLRTTVVSGSSETVKTVLTQLNSTEGTVFAGESRFRERPTRWLPLLAVAASFLVALGMARLRRIELASARHSGVTLADQGITVALESVAWVFVVVAVSVPVTVVFAARSLPQDAAAYVQIGVTAAALACAGGLAGSVTAVFMSGEKGLFRHVKGRR